MPYELYLKDDIGNLISEFIQIGKIVNVPTLEIQDGLITKGPYKIPVNHILFIKEVA